MNETIKQLFERKSTRVFEDKEIDKASKNLILSSALQAPTAGNQTMYTILDITDPNIAKTLSESCDHQPFIASAKMILVFCADFQKWYDAFCLVDENARKPECGDLMIAVSDTLIAAQNCVVAAESLGIGSCYIGDIMENCEFHRELFHLPEYVFPVAMLVFGYPTQGQMDRKKPPRLALEDIVQENYYHKKDKDDLIAMFDKQQQNLPHYHFHTWMDAFYKRKYASDFSKEMSRSVTEYLKAFLKE